MGRPPAFIFVVRHGKRLDAADRHWHLTSPTPYDPPLSYGGWQLSRTVGARIDSELQNQPAESSSKKPRRYRIIIHTSPFLRCVQTSISIAAGLATNSEYHANKPLLRVDAFLGEYLDPKYFEHITPPPESALMLVAAKAELLRKESYHEYHSLHARVHSATSPNQLWGSPSPVGSALDRLSGLANNLPRNDVEKKESPATRTARSMTYQHSQRPAYVSPVPSYALSSSEPIPKGYVAHARDACVAPDLHWDSSRDTMGWGDGGVLGEEWARMHHRFNRGLRRMVDWYVSTENPGEPCPRSHYESHTGQVAQDDDEDVEDVLVLVTHAAGCHALVAAITQQPVLSDFGISCISMAQRRPDFDSSKYTFTREKSFTSLDAALPRTKASLGGIYEMKLSADTEHLRPPTSIPSGAISVAGANPRSRPNALQDIFGAHHGRPSVESRSNSAEASLGGTRRSSGPSTSTPALFGPNQGGVTTGSKITTFATSQQHTRTASPGLWSPKVEDEEAATVESPTEADRKHEEPGAQVTNNSTSHPTATPETLPNARKDAEAQATDVPVQNDKPSASDNQDEEDDQFDEDGVAHPWAGKGNGGLWGTPRPPGKAERLRDHSSHKRRWTVNER